MTHKILVFLGLWELLNLVSANVIAQTIKKDRFIANQGVVTWVETVEIKDMDTPIIVEAMAESLQKKGFIQLESNRTNNVLTGTLLHAPSLGLAKATFRVDILYESYIVSVTAITLLPSTPIEKLILTPQKQFVGAFSPIISKLDEELLQTFSITF
ncbi:hypothetical protein FHS57_004658 [Runella defluvii]|uniref:DUF4468 domain-containing protein n=1 Tax=Runella defluvii TaxID=370973 RepID=A0A7W5ZPI3_9BACT|nr:hypothetical protein [Runella defluvii]MBB3840638.1 hypothetical protein [Runella defluvii]